jgi:hypothetical protein
MIAIVILNLVILFLVIVLLLRTQKCKSTSSTKHVGATNKTCPISGMPINHPGGEPLEVDLPNGNKVMVCSKNCKIKVEDLFETYAK